MKPDDPAARRLNAARDQYEDAGLERDNAICAAFDAGASLGEISLEVGMSRSAVGQLLRRHGRDTAREAYAGPRAGRKPPPK